MENFIEKQSPVLRWILFIPASALITLVSVISLGLCMLISDFLLPNIPINIKNCMQAFWGSASFVWWCTKIVPTHKTGTSIILNVIGSFIGMAVVVTMIWANSEAGTAIGNYIWTMISVICGIVGGWAAMVAYRKDGDE